MRFKSSHNYPMTVIGRFEKLGKRISASALEK